ncbi:ATP-binding protein [Ktedonobacter sp. SOSP1-52]|uniref:ATP-binding protein n=1 Tax=Ktedonobacter sp. SOSP1-52 TaxID=2778366 RepID=UPI0035B45839
MPPKYGSIKKGYRCASPGGAFLQGRFIRADNARAAGISGTRLGLYLCRMLVEQHRGRLWLTSEEGNLLPDTPHWGCVAGRERDCYISSALLPHLPHPLLCEGKL